MKILYAVVEKKDEKEDSNGNSVWITEYIVKWIKNEPHQNS